MQSSHAHHYAARALLDERRRRAFMRDAMMSEPAEQPDTEPPPAWAMPLAGFSWGLVCGLVTTALGGTWLIATLAVGLFTVLAVISVAAFWPSRTRP